MIRIVRVLAAVTAALVAGCSGSAVNVSPVPPTSYSEVGHTSGGACGMLLFSMIPIGINDRVERAYSRALLRSEATSLTDTSMTEEWYFALVGLVACTKVEGLALRRAEGAEPAPLDASAGTIVEEKVE